MKQVTIYTDGACSGNPGPGGWGAILQYGPHRKELSGGEAQTTNNRMELTGVIAALQTLKEPCEVGLLFRLQICPGRPGKGLGQGLACPGLGEVRQKPALNSDLWAVLLDLCDYHKVHLHWVKGHAENPFNNRCDELAVAESRKFPVEQPLFGGNPSFFSKRRGGKENAGGETGDDSPSGPAPLSAPPASIFVGRERSGPRPGSPGAS